MIVNTYVHTFGIIITVKTPIHYKFFATPIVKNTFSLEDSRSDLAVFLFCLFIVQTPDVASGDKLHLELL